MNSNIRITDDQVDVDGRIYRYDAASSGTPPSGGTPPGGGTTPPPSGGTTPPPSGGTTPPIQGSALFYRSANYQIVHPEQVMEFVAGTAKWQTKALSANTPAEGWITVPAGVTFFQLDIIPLPTGPVGQLSAEVNGTPVYGNDIINYAIPVGEGPIHLKVWSTAESQIQAQTKFQ